MSDATADMAERHGANLAELAEMGMALARDLHARAMAAKDEAEAAELALAFQRVSRSVRQSMALEARLAREAKRGAREDAQERFRQTLSGVQRKREKVRKAISPLIWTEAEGDEDAAEALFEGLEAILMDEDLLDEAFVAEPIEPFIARIRADLGLPPPDPASAEAAAAGAANGPAPDPSAWESSA